MTNTVAPDVLLAHLKCDLLIWYLAHNLSFLNRKPDEGALVWGEKKSSMLYQLL